MINHFPCGHWHKRSSKVIPIVPIVPLDIQMWQQSIDIIKSESFLSVGAPSIDDVQLLVAGVNYVSDSLLSSSVKDYTHANNVPGAIIARLVNGKKTSLYANYTFDADYYATLSFIGVNEDQTTWESIIDQSLTDDSYWLGESYLPYAMCILPNGKLVIAYSASDNSSTYKYAKVSSDYGATWDGPYVISTSGYARINLSCDTNGILYFTNTISGESGKAFDLFKSIDDGVTWTQIATAPAGTAQSDVLSCVSGTRIYVVHRVNYSNTLFYSDDGGVNWTTYSITVGPHDAVTAIKANGDNIVVHTYDGWSTLVSGHGYDSYLYNSIDAGANWAQLGQIGNATSTWPTLVSGHSSYPILANDSDVFIFSNCHAHVDETLYLGYLLSVDNGLNWEVKQLPILY